MSHPFKREAQKSVSKKLRSYQAGGDVPSAEDVDKMVFGDRPPPSQQEVDRIISSAPPSKDVPIQTPPDFYKGSDTKQYYDSSGKLHRLR